MGKYETLGKHLKNQAKTKLTLSFDFIEEEVLGFKLPDSARRYRAWWANDPTHVQAFDSWLSTGWIVKTVKFTEGVVTFTKEKGKNIPKTETSSTFKTGSRNKAYEFEKMALEILSKHFKVKLRPGEIQGIKKLFDFVSEDRDIIGDAKYFTMVKGKSLPPAKFSVIAEHVWLLGKVQAKRKFLVFGNDRRVPEEWLKRYGNLISDVEFYFIDNNNGKIEVLKGGK